MSRRLSILLLFTCAIVVATFFFSVPVHAGTTPQFSFTDINGKIYSSTELKGTSLVFYIGSHWWHKCKDEAPELQRAYLAYKDKGVLFLGVFAMSKVDEIKDFAEKYHLSYPVGQENGIAESLGVTGIPEFVFMDKEGLVVKRHSGVISYDELERDIKMLLK